MSVVQLINRDCILYVAQASGSTDDYGNPTDTHSPVTTVCELQQVRRDEPDSQGELSDTQWLAFFHPDEDMGDRPSANKLEVEGNVYEFVGAPWLARYPRSQTDSHIEAGLRWTRTVVGS